MLDARAQQPNTSDNTRAQRRALGRRARVSFQVIYKVTYGSTMNR
jgi:hypothetical protein